jgi:hypothetical protein
MKKTKDLVIAALGAAMLVGVQLILSGIAGVEMVSALLLCFAYSLGALRGVTIATLFSVVRCFVFGFHINVLILYLVYFNLFSLFFGWLGKRTERQTDLKMTIIVSITALLFTVGFTFLDVAITGVMYGFNPSALGVYLTASLYTMLLHLASVLVTSLVFFTPLVRVIEKIK